MDESYEYSMDDLNAGTLIFAQALSTLLSSGEGILIKAKGEAADYFGPKEGLIIVANNNGQMEIIPLSDVLDDTTGFEEGMQITIGEPETEDNDEQ